MSAAAHQERSPLLPGAGAVDARDAAARGAGQRRWTPTGRQKITAGLAALVAAGACALLVVRRSTGLAAAGAAAGGPMRADEEHSSHEQFDGVAKHLRSNRRVNESMAQLRELALTIGVSQSMAELRKLALKESEWDAIAAKLPRTADEVNASAGAAGSRAGGGVEPITVIADDEQADLGCSDSGGEDCSKTQCCNEEGHQCYQQTEWYAACMPRCSANASDWTCKELGERAPLSSPGACAAPGENCAVAGCCTEPGMQCYAFDAFASWSSCAYGCEPGVDWAANWTCEEIGERAPDPLECSWSGEACIHNHLCCANGQQCVRKNAMEAYCGEAEEGWDGEVLGGSRQEWEVQPVDGEALGSTLFCFMAVLPDSYEEELRDLARSQGASIFACDTSVWFSSRQAEFVTEGPWQSFVNTGVFKSVWGLVKEDGRYKQHDWTVKVDADSVFLPARLKIHLEALRAPKEVPIYIKNVDIDFGFLGAIEVLSKDALDRLFWSGVLDKCEQEVGSHSGEDGYLKDCLDMVGAGFMEDDEVLRNPAATDCTDQSRFCFHAFKDVETWQRCLDEAS